MPFVQNEEKQHGPSALASTIPIDEKEVLAHYLPYMRKSLDLEEVCCACSTTLCTPQLMA
jgi:hypothetical protein